MIYAILAISIVLLVPSCITQKPKQVSLSTSCDSDSALDTFFDSIVERDSFEINEPVLVTDHEALAEYEARLTDIPSHMSAQLIKGSVVEDSQANQYIQLHYQLPLVASEIIQYYRKEMERLGWCEYALFPGVEYGFIFEKPGTACLLILRPFTNSNKKNKTTNTALLITHGPKKSV